MKQPKFEIGDRVTYASPELLYQKNCGIGEVVGETEENYYIIWADNPKMECPHGKEFTYFPHERLIKVADLLEPQTAEPSKIDILPEIAKPKAKKKPKPKPSLPKDIKIGDIVCDLDNGVIGKVTALVSDRYITITTVDNILSHNLKLGAPRLEILEEPNKLDSLPEITTDRHGYFEHYQPVIKGAKSYWYRRYVYANISGKLAHHHVPNKMVESIETLWRSGATPKEICLALGKNIS